MKNYSKRRVGSFTAPTISNSKKVGFAIALPTLQFTHPTLALAFSLGIYPQEVLYTIFLPLNNPIITWA